MNYRQQDPMVQPESPQHGRKRPFRRMVDRLLTLTLSAALFGAVAGGSLYGVNRVLSGDNADSNISTVSTSSVTALSSTSGTTIRNGMDVSDIAEAALPCVVSITNLSVSFVDGSVYEAQLCGSDADMDLAVIKVALSDLSQQTLDQISVIAIGDSDALSVGEQVVAIGNALGYGQSVTTGIVSALNRSLTSEDGTTSTYIQTDAAINPGNSGGALINLDGELVGINTAKLSSTEVEGMGYAIPISDVIDLIAELMTQTTELPQTNQVSFGWYVQS